jgi:hypothetical protein
MPSAVPAPWVEHWDAATGKNYYRNTKTGQTQWETPLASASPGGLPPCWREEKQADGRILYKNDVQKRQQWERPQ